MPSLAFPDSETADPTTVLSALEMGKREWERGELRGAVRWIHRAADAAEAAGNDERALALARIAADIMSGLEQAAPPSSAPPSTPRDEGAALAPFDDFNDQTIVDSPAVMVARQTAQGLVSIEDRAQSPVAKLWSAGPGRSVRPRTTVRVAVGLAPTKDGAYSIFVLPEGEDLPSGTTEALLVMLDPEARFPAQAERA